MKSIRWRRLVLEGFGRFGDGVSLRLHDGVNTLVLPNEQGKSTLVAGLCAVLYGLGPADDPSGFTLARYRNWYEPKAFRGGLEFSVDGALYRLERDFDAATVRLSRLGDDGWAQEATGPHFLQSAARVHADRLRALLGLASRELFTATFCIVQPLPAADALEPQLQTLLAGAGRTRPQAALAHLAERLDALTHRDGELAALQARRSALHNLLAATIDDTALLQRQAAELAAALQKRQQIRAALERREALLQAWGRWELAWERYQAAHRRHGAAEAELAETLERTAHARAALVQQQERAAQDLRRIAAERARLLDRLATDLRTADRPAELQQNHTALQQAQAELARYNAEGRRLRAALEAAASTLAGLPDFSSLGSDPTGAVERLRSRQAALLSRWRQLQADRERLAAIRLELDGPLAGFSKAEPATLALAANYDQQRHRLLQDLEAARRELVTARQKAAQLAAEEQNLPAVYADLAGLDQTAAAAIEQKLALLTECAALQRQQQQLLHKAAAQRRPLLRAGLTGVSAVAGSLLASLPFALGGVATAAPWFLPALFGGGVAGAGVGLLAATRLWPQLETMPAYRQLQDELQQCNGRMAELAAALGPLAGAAAPALAAAKERLQARAEARQRLARRRAELPAEEALLQRLEEIQARLQELDDRTRDLRPTTDDTPGAAYERWRHLQLERRYLEQRLGDLAAADAADGGAESLGGEDWPALQALAAPHGVGAAASPAAVMAWLAERDAAWWDELSAKTRTFAAAQSALQSLQAELTQLQRLDDQGRTTGERLQGKIAALTQAIRPYTPDTTAQEIAAAIDAAGQCRRALAALAARESALAAVAAEAPAAAATDAALAELQERLQAAQTAKKAAAADLAALRAQWAELPDHEDSAQAAAYAEQRQHLQNEALAWRAELNALHQRCLDLRAQLARGEGPTAPSIAQLEQQMQALTAAIADCDFSARSLALAQRELSAALEEFHATYQARLTSSAGRYFAAITGGAGRTVDLDPALRFSVVEPDGQRVQPDRLSLGARDQLYLSLRLAIADLIGADAVLPLILDDPFGNCDLQRLSRLRAAITGAERQVLLLSHRDDLADWGRPATLTTGRAATDWDA